MVPHYTKRANQRILARPAMDKLEAAESNKAGTQRAREVTPVFSLAIKRSVRNRY